MSDDVATRRMMVKNAFITYYRNERDRAEKCITELVELFTEQGHSAEQLNIALLDRLISHYNRKS
jgi:hypothetical protein